MDVCAVVIIPISNSPSLCRLDVASDPEGKPKRTGTALIFVFGNRRPQSEYGPEFSLPSRVFSSSLNVNHVPPSVEGLPEGVVGKYVRLMNCMHLEHPTRRQPSRERAASRAIENKSDKPLIRSITLASTRCVLTAPLESYTNHPFFHSYAYTGRAPRTCSTRHQSRIHKCGTYLVPRNSALPTMSCPFD